MISCCVTFFVFKFNQKNQGAAFVEFAVLKKPPKLHMFQWVLGECQEF